MRVEAFLQQIRQDADLCLQLQHLSPQIQASCEEVKTSLIISMALRVAGATLAIFPLFQILKNVILLASATAASVSVTAIVSLSLATVSLILVRDLVVIGINMGIIHRLELLTRFTADSARHFSAVSTLWHGWHALKQVASASRYLVSELQGTPGELRDTWVAAPVHRAIKNLTLALRSC